MSQHMLVLLSLAGTATSAIPRFTPANSSAFDAAAFEDWLVAQRAAGASKVDVTPGRYAIPEPTRGLWAGWTGRPDGSDAGGIHLPLSADLTGLEVAMYGVTLVMGSRVATAVRITNWMDCALSGLTLEYATLPTNQATVTAIRQRREKGTGPGKTVLEVEVPAGYPLGDWDSSVSRRLEGGPRPPVLPRLLGRQRASTIPSTPTAPSAGGAARTTQQQQWFTCNVFVGPTRFLRIGAPDLSLQSVTPLPAAGRRRFAVVIGQPVAAAVGDTLGCRNAEFAFTFWVHGNARTTFKDITIKGGPGFGVFHDHPAGGGARNTGGNRFVGMSLTYPAKPPGASVAPVLSASADGFHINGVPNGPSIKDMLIEGHNDDGIAIHGQYSLVVDKLEAPGSPNKSFTTEIGGGGTDQPGPWLPWSGQLWLTHAEYEVGDTVKLYDPAFRAAGWVKVTAIGVPQPPGRYRPPGNASHTMPHTALDPEPQAWYVLLSVTGAALPGVGFDWVAFNADKGSAGFELINNTIRNHRARGMLIKASNGVVAENRIENSTLGGIIITPELAWGEGDYVTNVTVTGNTVRNVCIGVQCYGGLGLGAVGPSHELVPAPGHTNVSVMGNRFDNISQMNLWVSSAAGIMLDANVFVDPYSYGPVATCCPPVPLPDPVSHPVVAFITETARLTARMNCVEAGPAGARTTAVNVTSTVIDSHTAGGFTNCTPGGGASYDSSA